MPQTLEQQSQQHNNNYTHLEALYHDATGSELMLDPYRSAFNAGPKLILSSSVVIPAWNACDTLEQCLIAIEQSTFNRKYQQQLEVVVVDDGSTDGTWELLQQLRLNVRLKAVRQAHHSRAHTQNTGIAVAEGDVIIYSDVDMILTPFTSKRWCDVTRCLTAEVLWDQPIGLLLIDGLHDYTAEYKKPACAGGWSGNVLFSHGAAPTVSSELEGLTAVFEMGTGVSL